MWLIAAVAGALTVLTGLLSGADAVAVTERLLPVLAFLVAATVLAELADRAGVFDVAAGRAARLGRGRTPVLFALVVLLATATTVVLSLDTTAVLVTPVVLALARRLNLDPFPFAFAAVWLANTASLLLPVSNLTNLLAVDRLELSPAHYAGRTAAAAAVAVAVTVLALALAHHRSLRGRYLLPGPEPRRDRVLLWTSALACLALVPAVLTGLPVAVVFGAAAAVVVAATALRSPRVLRPSLVPWRLVLLVEGLFLVVSAAGPHGLDALLRGVAGPGDAPGRVVAAAAVGGNLVNNLPAYLALERVIPPSHLLDVLVGVDLGPLVLPWASLATLLWHERCKAAGVVVPWTTYAVRGVLLVPPLLLLSSLALHA